MKSQHNKLNGAEINERVLAETPEDIQKHDLESVLSSLYEPIVNDWLSRRVHYVKGLEKAQSLKTGNLSAQLGIDFTHGNNICTSISGCKDIAKFLRLRIWVRSLHQTTHLLKLMHEGLQSDGLLLLEIIRFSGYTAYPYHYSFARAVELMTNLETNRVLPEQWPGLLHQNGFNILDRVNSSSAFLSHEHKSIISSSLETFRSEILQHTTGTLTEINALMPVLIQYEGQKDTLICRPGVQLILAKKNETNE